MPYPTIVDDAEAKRIAAEISEREGLKVSALGFDCGNEVGIKINWTDGVRHGVRFPVTDASQLRGLIEDGVARCIQWKRESDAKKSEAA